MLQRNISRGSVSNNHSRVTSPRTSVTLNKVKKEDSITKPTIRKISKPDDFNNRNAVKRRTYSLKDKTKEGTVPSGSMNQEESRDRFQEENPGCEPVKDSSDTRTLSNGRNQSSEPFGSGTETLEYTKSSTYAIADERMETDDVNTDDTEEQTIRENVKSSEKMKKSINNANIKKDYSPSIKTERKKPERKVPDHEEIMRNYENEISVLKKQLQQSGVEPNQSEDNLLAKCSMLESQLRRSQNEAESLNDQVSGLRSQLQTWPNRVRELEDENETLRGRIEDVRVINTQRQNQIDELHEIVKNLETKLWEQSSGTNHQEKVFLQRLMSEYDHLLKDYDLVKLNNVTNERRVYEARSRIGELTSKLSDFEINYRKMESENILLRKRISNEKVYGSHNFRGWDRNVYPPQNKRFHQDYDFTNGSEEFTRSQPSPKPMDSGMMSMSCYGALPSYAEKVESEDDGSSSLRRFEFMKARATNDRYMQSDQMNQSLYVQSKKEGINVSTPTNDRRRVAILDKVQHYGNGALKDGAPSFESLNDESIDLMSQGRHISDIQASQQISRRRQKPDLYNRDSWVESKTEEEKELERCYDQLQNEKKQLLTNLSHIPTNSTARNRRSNREQRENLETQLDHIDRQLGLMRMTLKQKNILK